MSWLRAGKAVVELLEKITQRSRLHVRWDLKRGSLKGSKLTHGGDALIWKRRHWDEIDRFGSGPLN